MKKAYCKYILSLLLFGSNGLVVSNIALSSYEIVLLRSLIASVFLAAVFLVSRSKPAFPAHKRQLLYILVSGMAMAGSWMFLFEAYQQIGVSITSLIYNFGPVVVMVLSPLLFRERLTWPRLTGFFVVLCGILLVNGQAQQEGKSLWGLLCAALSAAMYALMVISNKKARDITGLENSMLQLIVAFFSVTVFVGVKQGLVIPIAPEDWAPILLLGFVNTGVGCYLYFSSIGRLPSQSVAICGYLEPLSSIVFSVLFLHEVMRPVQIFGAALILGGAAFGECMGSRLAPPRQEET